MAGSLVEAARREVSDWGPWLPLPQGDRWILIGMDVVGDDHDASHRWDVGLDQDDFVPPQRKESWNRMSLLPVCSQSRSLLSP